MELVRGIPITEYCDQGSLSTQERLDLFVAVCNAVQHAHQRGVIHRDIKPSNVRQHRFFHESKGLSREEAMTRFVDATVQPGPSTWKNGIYPEGEDDYPGPRHKLVRGRCVCNLAKNALPAGSPRGYSQTQPWHNSGIAPDGSLRPAYLARLGRILDRADELGMVVILGLFYFGQDERLAYEAAVLRAVDAAGFRGPGCW